MFWLLIKLLLKKSTLTFGRIYLFSFAGYATHGLLDACTSYGTQLFWPFSSERVAWNNVSIIDPLFTLPLLLIVSIAMFQQSRKLAIIGASYGLIYLSLGLIQEQRAILVAGQLAETRGHQAINITVKPSFMNLIVWKSQTPPKSRPAGLPKRCVVFVKHTLGKPPGRLVGQAWGADVSPGKET